MALALHMAKGLVMHAPTVTVPCSTKSSLNLVESAYTSGKLFEPKKLTTRSSEEESLITFLPEPLLIWFASSMST